MPRPSQTWKFALRVTVLLFAGTMLVGYAIYSQRVANPRRMMRGSKSTQVLEDLRQIDSAVDQWAVENNRVTDNNRVSEFTVSPPDVQKYVEAGHRLSNQAPPSSRTVIDELTGSGLSIDYSIPSPGPLPFWYTNRMMTSSKSGAVTLPEMVRSVLPDVVLAPPVVPSRLAPSFPGTKPVEELRIQSVVIPDAVSEESVEAERARRLMMAGSKSAPVFKIEHGPLAINPSVASAESHAPLQPAPPPEKKALPMPEEKRQDSGRLVLDTSKPPPPPLLPSSFFAPSSKSMSIFAGVNFEEWARSHSTGMVTLAPWPSVPVLKPRQVTLDAAPQPPPGPFVNEVPFPNLPLGGVQPAVPDLPPTK